MDRRLKERIVGAVVLVVLAVLIVPVFLDGPAVDGLVSEAVTLPGQNGQPRKQQTIILNRDRTQPVPVSAANTPDSAQADTDKQETAARPATQTPPVTAEKPDPTPPEPRQAENPAEGASTGGANTEGASTDAANTAAASAEEPPPDKPPAAEARSSTGMWAVQLGSFSKSDNAERLAADLRSKGYAAFLSELQGPKGPLQRVRIGPQKDRDSAEKVAARLSAEGIKGQVVPHP
jgi:DedD protein